MNILIGLNLILYVVICIWIFWSSDENDSIEGLIKMWKLLCLLTAFLTTGIYLIFK